MPIRVVTPPATEPLSLEEAKAHLRLEQSADDAYVTTLIKAAREYVEQVCWRGLVTQTLEVTMDRFPDSALGSGVSGMNVGWSDWQKSKFELPFGKLVTLTSVKYLDVNGVEQTMPSSDYTVDDVSIPAKVYLGYNKVWPNTRPQWDAVRVRYDVGQAVNVLPSALKQAMLLLISQMYEFRTPEVTGTIISSVQFAFDSLVQPYRLIRY